MAKAKRAKPAEPPGNASDGLIGDGFAPENQETLERLVKILDYAEGFTLLFARCNVPILRRRLSAAIKHRLTEKGIRVSEIEFDGPVQEIRRLLREHLAAESASPVPALSVPSTPVLSLNEPAATYTTTPKRVLFVSGLEYSIPYDQSNARLLAEFNLGRELFQRDTPLPLLIWLPDYALTAVARHAPDFWAWRSGVFEFVSEARERSQALDQLNSPDNGANALFNMSVEQKQRRLRLLESIWDDYEQLRDDSHTINERTQILFDLGMTHYALGELAQAIDYYTEALQLRRQIGDILGEATILNNIGKAFDGLAMEVQALDYYNRALPLFRQIYDRIGEANTLNNIGMVYHNRGEKAEALNYFNQVLPLYRQVGNKQGEAATLNNIGVLYDNLGKKLEAIEYYYQAIPLYRHVGDKGGEASAFTNIGAVYRRLNDKARALEYYNLALLLYRQVGDKRGEATTLNNIGWVYDELGEKQQALAHYNQALELLRQIGDKIHEAGTLQSIGKVYDDLGEKAQAIEYYNQAISLIQRWTAKSSVMAKLTNP